MASKKVVLILTLLLIIIIAGCAYNKPDSVKIGIVTDLTGPASYWGESSRAGAELAKLDLEAEGYSVDLIYEDYQLDAAKALSSAQKLVNIDNVDGIYAEFNPAAISVGSFLSDKNILFVYDAAVTSPLEGYPLAYKTYLDYKEGCKTVASNFKSDGIEKIGVLKVNLEFGELCLSGVKEVYGENTFVEGYNLGDQDFKTQLLKLSTNDVGAVVNVGFEGDTLNTLRVIKEQGLDILYGTVDDTITSSVLEEYASELEGGYSFGFSAVDSDFKSRLDPDLTSDYGAAITYTHIKQMVKALSACDTSDCISNKMDNSQSDTTIKFQGFSNRIASIDMAIKEY